MLSASAPAGNKHPLSIKFCPHIFQNRDQFRIDRIEPAPAFTDKFLPAEIL